MDQIVKKKKFNKRSFSSFTILVSALILPFSGIMNHFLQAEQVTVQKHFWMSVHNMAGAIFVIFAIIHISYNWKTLLGYLKKTKEFILTKEALAAIILITVLVGLFSSHAFHAG